MLKQEGHMNSLKTKLILLGGAAALAAGIAAPASATDLYFQMNPNYSTSGVRQAFIFGSAGSTGTVSSLSGFSQAFTLGSDGFATVDLPISDELGSGYTENKGYTISSASAISGYFLSRVPYSTDMSYLIDGSKLGTNYYTANYNSGIGYPDQVSVQATKDNTNITITPTDGNPAVNITLNAGQTYMYTSGGQLTGTHVQSSAPIAVFSGNQCTDIPAGAVACDHIDEQMVSTDQLSTSYVLGKTARSGTGGDVYRVVATVDNTTVKVNGSVVATLNAGQFYENRIPTGAQIDADQKVMVAQYLPSQTASDGQNTDPAMTIVPGADQWLKSYVFATPSGSADFPTDYVTIVAKTSTLGSLMVAGALADTSGFTAIAGTDYSFGNIDVSSTVGAFSITASDPFELLLEGYDSYDSYFTYGGAAFSPGASPPPPPSGVPEPITWAMMIGGLGVAGGMMRRRYRKSEEALTAQVRAITFQA
jgi:hypothetical protein